MEQEILSLYGIWTLGIRKGSISHPIIREEVSRWQIKCKITVFHSYLTVTVLENALIFFFKVTYGVLADMFAFSLFNCKCGIFLPFSTASRYFPFPR